MRSIYWMALGLLVPGCAVAQEQGFTYEYQVKHEQPAERAADKASQEIRQLIVQSKIIGPEGLAVSSMIQGAPYSADEVTQFSQTLADGTHIQRETKVTIYRDGEGRVRRDSPDQITIMDPVTGVGYALNPKTMTGRKITVSIVRHTTDNGASVSFSIKAGQIDTASADKLKAKIKAEQETTISQMKTGAGVENQFFVFGSPTIAHGGAAATASKAPLVTQSIEGVLAEGSRSEETIPVGTIGNDRPLQIVNERWYSPELKTVIMTRHSDPRSGDETFKLTNIRRGEPDPSVFQLPAGYQILGN